MRPNFQVQHCPTFNPRKRRNVNFGRKRSFDVGDTVNGEREIFGSAPLFYSPAGSQWEFCSNEIKVSSIEILQMDFHP